jgi:CoA:oxalate CoA-transferase
MTKGALDGLKVLEFCDMVAGPYCGKLLADLGAESIKIERPLVGDRARERGPFAGDFPHPDKSGLFLYLNTNKLGVTLDPSTATGRSIFRRLVEGVDVLIEDQVPGRMADLGLDYDSLSTINPGLVMVSVTPFGQYGPYAEYNCYTLNLHHVSAHTTQFFVARFDEPGREPVPPGGFAGEYDSGLNAGIAVLGALFGRMLTGEGQYVDVSKQDGLLGLERVDMCRFADGEDIIGRFGQQIGGLMECKDGFVILTMPQDHQWFGLVEAMGSPEWANNEEYADEMGRAKHHDDIQPRVEAWAMQFTKDEIYRVCQEHSVPLGPVRSTQEVFDWQQARERGFFQEVEHPVAGKFYYPTAGYKFSETPWQARYPAPLLGQHNEEVYCGRLGFSKEELERLRTDGVI